jgi:hypothetical protein
MHFVARNSNKLQKLGLGRKFGWAFNVFTLGLMVQATLVHMQWTWVKKLNSLYICIFLMMYHNNKSIAKCSTTLTYAYM